MFLFTTVKCISCGNILTRSENAICLTCRHKMARTYMLPHSHNAAENRMNEITSVSWAYSHFIFDKGNSIVRRVVHEFKYHGNRMLAYEMGMDVGEYMKQNGLTFFFDLLVPVPVSWIRRFSRGYNQAAEFAKGLSKATGIEMRTDILKRKSWASSQSSRNAEQRAETMSKNAFVAHKNIYEISDKRIAIVDDVLTTGATLAACCRAIREKCPDINIGVLTFSINN